MVFYMFFYMGPYKALKGLIRPLRAYKGLEELIRSLEELIRP